MAVPRGSEGALLTAGPIPVGQSPLQVVFDPVDGNVYVANWGSDSVTVISTPQNSVVATVSSAGNPVQLGVDATTGNVYVVSALHSDRCDCWDSGALQVLSGSSLQWLANVLVHLVPTAVAFDPSHGMAYVGGATPAWLCSCGNGGAVAVVSTSSDQLLAEVALPSTPRALGLDPISGKLYSVDGGTPGTMRVIDTGTDRVVAGVTVGADPGALVVDPTSGDVYVLNEASSEVLVYDRNGTSVATIGVGAEPQAMALDPVNRQLYVANRASSTVSVVAPLPGAAVTELPLEGSPFAIDVDRATGDVYVLTNTTLGLVDGHTNHVAATVAVPSDADALAVDPTSHSVYVLEGGGSVTVVGDLRAGATSTSPGPLGWPWIAWAVVGVAGAAGTLTAVVVVRAWRLERRSRR